MYDLANPDTIKNILKKYNLAPNKFLGQNFLIDQNILDKIIETANLKAGDNVLEIGPGLGTLTEALCSASANVVVIEKDKELIPSLKENLKEFKNLKIINNDFLQIEFTKINSSFWNITHGVTASPEYSGRGNPADVAGSTGLLSHFTPRNDIKKRNFKYKVVSNIPYYITSPVIRKIFSFSTLPTEIIFLVQREVAERISAKQGDMSLISLFAQFYGTPSIIEIVKPESFFPKPKVESAILKISIDKKRKISQEKTKALWQLAKIGFSSRRKTLANNLSAGFHMPRKNFEDIIIPLGFTAKARAQELSVEGWIKLLNKLDKIKN